MGRMQLLAFVQDIIPLRFAHGLGSEDATVIRVNYHEQTMSVRLAFPSRSLRGLPALASAEAHFICTLEWPSSTTADTSALLGAGRAWSILCVSYFRRSSGEISLPRTVS